MKAALLFFAVFAATSCFAQQGKLETDTAARRRILSPEEDALVKEWFYEGLKAKTIQNEPLATEYFKRVIQVDPSNDASLFELANISHEQDQELEAEHYAREAVAVNPGNEWYWLLLGEIYKKNNDLSQLVGVFDQLISIRPESDGYYFDKAKALLLLNRIDEAQSVYDTIGRRFGPSDDLKAGLQRVYLKQGKTEKVIGEIEGQVKADPEQLDNYLLLADIYSNEKNKDKALDVLQRAKEIDPSNAFVHLSLADLYQQKGKSAEAFSELEAVFSNENVDIDTKIKIILAYLPQFSDTNVRTAAERLSSILIKVHPKDPKAYSVYGDVLVQAGKLRPAISMYRNALELNGQVDLIWEQLVRIQLSVPDFQGAIQDGEKALTIFPDHGSLYYYTAVAYAQQHEYGKAIPYLKKAATLETENKQLLSQIYSSLGDCYHAAGDFGQSDLSYDKALQFDDTNAYTLNNYAYYLSLRGENLLKAAKMSLRSNELDPENASFQDTYAWILFRQKKYKEARIWMEKSLKNQKSGSLVRSEHYGDILFFCGEKEKALEQWKKARELGMRTEKLERKINERKYFE